MSSKHTAAQKPKQGTGIVIDRVFDVPREHVWRAWTEPEQCKKWWGPKDYTAPLCKMDFRVGGKNFCCMRSPEGKDFYSTGTYREIVKHQRFVVTDSFADEKGNVVPASYYGMPGEFPLELMVTVTFTEQDGKTKMTLQHDGFPAGEMADMCREGWNQSFDKLAEILE